MRPENYRQEMFGNDYVSNPNSTSSMGSTNSLGSSWNNALTSPLGLAGGALGGLLGSLFGGDSGPDPMNYLNQITGQASPYLKPYSQAGEEELGPLAGIFGQLSSDPGAMLNKIGGQFHQSPGFNFAMQQAMQAANQGAAAGGMAGSPAAQQQAQHTATGLANQDYYNWLNQATGMFGQGLQGMQGLAGMGMQAGSNMANLISQALATQAQEAYAQRANQSQSGSGIGGILGDIAGAAMHFI